MQYALLIYGNQTDGAGLTEAERDAVMQEWWTYDAWLHEQGWKRGGEALHETTQATTVRVRDGKTLTTDGPFAETKEQLGGFYVVECANLDEAIDASAKCPAAFAGSTEIRPVVDFGQEAPS